MIDQIWGYVIGRMSRMSNFYIGGSPLTIMVITGRKSRHLGTEIMSFIGIN